MDRYEYKLKLEQIKDLFSEKDYQTAATIAETINWKKVKNTSTLCMVGEIYAQVDQFEVSKDILLMAYERSPLGRSIIYRLTQVAIKLGTLDEAQEYYEEFLNIAPHDNMKYVLKYEIAKAGGARQEELIEILEEFKEREYTEEWTFELAYLYHHAEMGDKCVEICDELILWFGEGEYVEKALELKMLYQPLNRLQEDKYNRIKQKQDGIVRITKDEELKSGEIVSGDVQIPQITSNTGKFNTINLQAEIAKSMQHIVEAKERETVADTMEHIKNMVKEMPYFEMPTEKENEHAYDKKEENEAQYNMAQYLNEPAFEREPLPEPEESGDLMNKQITGQMSIGDILSEWEEKQKTVEQKQLESMKSKALSQTQELLEQITDALPQIEEEPVMEEEEPMPEPVPQEPVVEEKPVVDDTIPLPRLKLPNFLRAETKPLPTIDEDMLVEEVMQEAREEMKVEQGLTAEQRKIFSYFISVEGMEGQIFQAIQGVIRRKRNQKSSSAGNVVIMGGKGCGKTVFATCMVKAIQKITKDPEAKVGKITGSSMNQKDIVKLLKKVEGGYLIIEKAGELSKESVLKLSSIMDYDTKGLLVILEDTKVGIEKVLSRHAMFTNKFTEKIRIPIFTSNELVAFAQAYANEYEFEIDEMGILALYNCISNIQKLDQPTTLEEVKVIMDQAMEKSRRSKFIKLFGGKRYNEQGYVYLREKDFDDY